MRRGIVVLALSLAGSALLSGAAIAAPPRPEIRAVLDGRTVKPAEISRYYCHDFDFPRIECFSTAAGLEAAAFIESSGAGSISASFGPNDYVTVYSGPTFSGTYAHLSQNYDTLFWIGWNDQISSYKGRNTASGTFWSDWYGTGRATNFCCNANVSYLPAAIDNTFTSVYRH